MIQDQELTQSRPIVTHFLVYKIIEIVSKQWKQRDYIKAMEAKTKFIIALQVEKMALVVMLGFYVSTNGSVSFPSK